MKYKHKRLTELFLGTRFTGEFHFFHVHIFQNIRNEHNFVACGIFIRKALLDSILGEVCQDNSKTMECLQKEARGIGQIV